MKSTDVPKGKPTVQPRSPRDMCVCVCVLIFLHLNFFPLSLQLLYCTVVQGTIRAKRMAFLIIPAALLQVKRILFLLQSPKNNFLMH